MFEHLNDILFHKRGDKLDNVDHETDYNPYMINRWVSMYSDEACHVVNNTVNWLYATFDTKTQHYNFLQRVLPAYRQRYIQYIKKHKPPVTPATDDEQNVVLLSRNLELSETEVKYLLQQQHEHKHRPNNTH